MDEHEDNRTEEQWDSSVHAAEEAKPEEQAENFLSDSHESAPMENREASDDQVGENEEPAMSDYELNEVIESLCLSKVEEFKMLGYEHVSGKEIWDCVSDKYRKTGVPPLHQIVNDILSLKSTQFMNWMTLSAFKGAQL
ncbi:post-transcriptional regulator [Paenibacillus hexagrammi]|nr:post-transcriptional regulator [Paenibacillus sp. YPD9-1]